MNGCSGSPKLLDVRERQLVRARDAHRAGLAVEPGRERLAQREDAPADAVLRLEDDRVVAGARQLVGRDEPGQAGADDRHAAAGRRAKAGRCVQSQVHGSRVDPGEPPS